nr:hypothetical protein Q903MT_gene1246 [Picea sitchensis]
MGSITIQMCRCNTFLHPTPYFHKVNRKWAPPRELNRSSGSALFPLAPMQR